MTSEYIFSGPFPGRKDPRTRTKGIMAARKLQKRKEAEQRNAHTEVENTAWWRKLSPAQREELSKQDSNSLP